jgi:hypothetical protein
MTTQQPLNLVTCSDSEFFAHATTGSKKPTCYRPTLPPLELLTKSDVEFAKMIEKKPSHPAIAQPNVDICDRIAANGLGVDIGDVDGLLEYLDENDSVSLSRRSGNVRIDANTYTGSDEPNETKEMRIRRVDATTAKYAACPDFQADLERAEKFTGQQLSGETFGEQKSAPFRVCKKCREGSKQNVIAERGWICFNCDDEEQKVLKEEHDRWQKSPSE